MKALNLLTINKINESEVVYLLFPFVNCIVIAFYEVQNLNLCRRI